MRKKERKHAFNGAVAVAVAVTLAVAVAVTVAEMLGGSLTWEESNSEVP
jgi:hypothetical protein